MRKTLGSLLAAAVLMVTGAIALQGQRAPARHQEAMMCSPSAQVVCTVLGLTVCRKYTCG
jgi:hypothetical protein